MIIIIDNIQLSSRYYRKRSTLYMKLTNINIVKKIVGKNSQFSELKKTKSRDKKNVQL